MKKELMYFNEQKDIFKGRIERGIQENRKGTVVLKFNGDINNANIKIEQKSHDFKFGCNTFMLDSFDNKEKRRCL